MANSSFSYAIKREFIRYFQKHPPEVLCKKDALKDFANLTEKHLWWSFLLIKLQVWRPATLLKRNSNIAKFLRAPVLKNIDGNIYHCVCISEIQTINLHTSQKRSILEFTKYFLTSSALQTLVSSNLYLFLRLSCLLNISNVSYSNSLNRWNGLTTYQKFVPMENAWVQVLFSKAV